MSDTKDLCEDWVRQNIHKEFTPIDIEDVYKAFDGAWQAATLAERERCAKLCDEYFEAHVGELIRGE